MLWSCLKTAVRSLLRDRTYAAINLVGLAVGLAVCGIIAALVRQELSFDELHVRGEHIVRLVNANDEGEVTDDQPAPLGPLLAEQLPGVRAAVRFSEGRGLLSHGERRLYGKQLLYADASLFDVFSFELLRGDPATALARPRTIVLTEELAAQLFGDDDPVGQTVRVQEERDFEVTGIVRRPPACSSIQFTALVSFATRYEEWHYMLVENAGGWNMRAFATFLLLEPGADTAALAAQIPATIARATNREGWLEQQYQLQPLRDVHLDHVTPNGLGPQGDRRQVVVMASVAVLVLALAVINYVNLATARLRRRDREAGVRKAVGATRGQLALQVLGESVLVCLLAGVVAVALTEAVGAWALQWAGVPFDGLERSPQAALFGLVLVMGLGLLAGAYPALSLSRLSPALAVRGVQRRGGRAARVRQGLVIVQFALSAALLTVTLVVWQQLRFVLDGDLGMRPDGVLVLSNPRALDQSGAQGLKEDLLADPRFASVSLAERLPPGGFAMITVQAEGRDEPLPMQWYGVDGDFVATLGIDVVAGRAITDDPADRQAIVVNETAVRRLGWAEPLGKTLFFNGVTRRVVGVVRDFHHQSLHHVVTPLFMVPASYPGAFVARVQGDDLAGTVAAAREAWAARAPAYPVQYSFLDDDLAAAYESEQHLARSFTLAFASALLIACVGLFGLSAHAARERTREIGVRKVLGASSASVVGLLAGSFLRLAGVALVLGAPLAWWAARRWLDEFAYRVDLGPAVFAAAGALVVAVALLAVGQQSIRAALTDPVDALRYE